MRPLLTLLLSFSLSLLSFSGISQRFHFEKITEAEGLSDNRVTCFIKDRAGFMWIGTENGLNRYDGHEFRIYRPGQSKFSLSHEHINDIEQDSRGRFWISTWGGLNVLEADKDSLYVFTPDEDAYRQIKKRIGSVLVWDTYIDKKDRVWIALDVRDLSYYDPVTREFNYFPWKDFIKKTFPPGNNNPYSAIQRIIRRDDDQLWLGTTRGLFSFNVKSSEFRFHGGDNIQDCVSLYYDSTMSRVIFGQQNLYAYDEGTDRLTRIEKSTGHRSENNLLAPTLSGLWEVDPSTRTGTLLAFHEKNQFSMHHQEVKAVHQEDGTDWIGTREGVLLHSKNLELFQFNPVFSDTTQITAGNVYHIYDDEEKNRLYLTSYTKNLFIIINKETGERKELASINGKSLQRPSRTFVDSHGRLWLLTARHIFFSDDHTHFSVFPFPKENDSYLFNDMVEDAEGNYWFSSLRHGVYLYNTKTSSGKLLKNKPDGLFAHRPTRLMNDAAHGALWISDFSFGVFRYDTKAKEFKYHGMDSNDPNLLQSSLSVDLTIDKQGDVWVATSSGGVSRYSQKEKTFTTYSMKTGLPENTINSVQGDLNGNIWLATHKGLTCMRPNGKVIKHFDRNNNLPYTNFSTPFSINKKGELFIGIAHGYLKFHPDSLATATPDFPVVITSASVAGMTLSPTSNKFSFDQNDFNAQFSALTYSMPRKVTYYYKLEGYDADWIAALDKHEVSYTNLNNRSYSFKVKAVDYGGKTSSNVAEINFTIDAPFWERWWFISIISVLIIAGLYLWRQSLQRKIHSQEILNQVATSLYNQNTYEEVFWTVARNCIDLLKFEDCVIYLLDDRGVLIQKAAGGPKNKEPFRVNDPIEIPLGRGIVGTVAATGKPEIISDTSRDRRYIIDDHSRFSEISVPIVIDGKVFGVIDSEHHRRNFFSRWHLKMLQEIAAICSAKISRYFVEEQIRSKVARDLHDDMGSSLSSINIMSKIAIEKNEPIISTNYLKAIRENASLMQDSLSDIIWAINPKNDSMENVVIRMKEFTAEILEPLDIQYEFIEEGDLNLTRMDINMRKDFYLIFKEAINNAAKYSTCKRVVVQLSQTTHHLKLKIQDDGIGFSLSANGSGNGLKNMRHRAVTIKADLKIQSSPGEGSVIILSLPSHDQGIQTGVNKQ